MQSYTDRAAFNDHLERPHIKKVTEQLETGLLSKEPEVLLLDQLEGFELGRPEAATQADPVLVWTELQYKPGTAESILGHWKSVFETTRDDEQGALLWQLAKNPNDANKLYVVHAYVSRDFLLNVHATSKALKETQAFGKDIQTGVVPVFLKLHAGFLYKKGA